MNSRMEIPWSPAINKPSFDQNFKTRQILGKAANSFKGGKKFLKKCHNNIGQHHKHILSKNI
ncbi:hypothetical protein BTR25_10480 [Bacillus sp. MRMR6]|nr:hypothetical protein BTR25_10480 [Bacillus sp. MRMR6]